MLRIVGKTNIDFIGKRKIAFIFSGILITLGIISAIAIIVGKADLGIDFTGGVLLHGNFEKSINISELRSALNEAGFKGATITEVQGENVPPNSVMIRYKTTQVNSDSLFGDRILSAIRKNIPDNKFALDSIDDIGPSVGKNLQSKARLAILLSLLGILAYIWIRFDFRFAVAATVATFHDVLAVMGVFFIFHKEITLLVVTALLTLAGYSLTDTVVVYDRIRENLKMFRKRSSFGDTINKSINEMLSRTLMTSITSILVVFVVFVLGGEVVHDFALALILGMIIGTYSSVFVASPMIYEWEKRSPKRMK